MIELNWIGIVVIVVVCLIMFAIGWGIGFRVGFRDGDGQWRKNLDPKSGKVVTLDKHGRVMKLNPEEQNSLDEAMRNFNAGKPAKVDRPRGKR